MARTSRSCRRKSFQLQKRVLATVLEHVDEQNQEEEAGSQSQQQVALMGTVGFPISKDQRQSEGQAGASGSMQRSAERCASTHNPQDHCCNCPYCRQQSQWARGSGRERDGHRQMEKQPCPVHGDQRGHYRTVSTAGQHALMVQLQANPEPVYLDPSKLKIGVKTERRLGTAQDFTPRMSTATSHPSTSSMMREGNAAASNDTTSKLGHLLSPPLKSGNEDFARKLDAWKPFAVELEVGRRRVAPGIAQQVTCQPEEQRRPVNEQEKRLKE